MDRVAAISAYPRTRSCALAHVGLARQPDSHTMRQRAGEINAKCYRAG